MSKEKGTEQRPDDYIMDLGDLSLNDIVGQDNAIKEFRSFIESLRYGMVYRSWALDIPRGILLTGGPGLGKTASVRAVARELKNDVILMELRYMDIASKWVDYPIEQLKSFFSMAEEQSKEKHVIIFIDEIDSMIPQRSDNLHETSMKRVNVFLAWMDGGFSKLRNVTLIGATNYPEGIDTAAKRPGRFDKIIEYVPLTASAIMQGLQNHMGRRSLGYAKIKEIDWDQIQSIVRDGCLSGADLPEVVNCIIRDKVTEHVKNLCEKANFNTLTKAEQSAAGCNPEYLPEPIDTANIRQHIFEYIKFKGKESSSFGFMMHGA